MHALATRDVSARLARVGDAIDFVVTLGVAADGRGGGVLERQTQTGTVAIRRVDDPSCDQVAEALALTLALAVQGARTSPAPNDVPAPALAPAAAEAEPATPPTTTPQPAAVPPSPPGAALRDAGDAADAGTVRAQASGHWSLGLQAFAATGLLPDVLPGGSAFVDIGWGGGNALWRPVLRIGALAAFASSSEAGRDMQLRVLGGRVAGCPLAFGADALVARPCLALELGQVHSEIADQAALPPKVCGPHRGGGAPGLSRFGPDLRRGRARPARAMDALHAALASDATVVHGIAALGSSARIGAVLHFL